MFIIINFGDGTRNIFSADLGAVINSDLSFKDYKKNQLHYWNYLSELFKSKATSTTHCTFEATNL